MLTNYRLAITIHMYFKSKEDKNVRREIRAFFQIKGK